MIFTIGDWVLFGVWVLITICVSVFIYVDIDEFAPALINFLISFIIACGVMGIIAWYNTSTAAGSRNIKDYESNLNNGIDREITITAEDGREIFHYEGKVDVETDHEDNYILFDDQDGKRYMIYYGIQDTVLIIEK